MTDQPWELNRYTRFTLVYVLLTIVADGLGLLLGAIANPIVSISFQLVEKRKCRLFPVWSNHVLQIRVLLPKKEKYAYWMLKPTGCGNYHSRKHNVIFPD